MVIQSALVLRSGKISRCAMRKLSSSSLRKTVCSPFHLERSSGIWYSSGMRDLDFFIREGVKEVRRDLIEN